MKPLILIACLFLVGCGVKEKEFDVNNNIVDVRSIVQGHLLRSMPAGCTIEKIQYIAPEYNNYGDYISVFVYIYKTNKPWIKTCGDVWVEQGGLVVEDEINYERLKGVK